MNERPRELKILLVVLSIFVRRYAKISIGVLSTMNEDTIMFLVKSFSISSRRYS
jgi:hypothetical protein